MIFVDTSAWYASTVPQDPNHLRASEWLSANTAQLTTTDYVLDETLTLLKAHGLMHRAMSLGQLFFGGQLTDVYHLSEGDIAEAWHVFQHYSDKGWSFTDCTSKVVMDRLGIAEAFSFDRHFEQFGSVKVVP